jgi:hypothetical protein
LSKYADLRESTKQDLINAAELLQIAKEANVEAMQAKAKVDKRFTNMSQQ